MERAERIIALAVGLAFSVLLIPVLWVMLVLTSITVVQRFVKVWRQASAPSKIAGPPSRWRSWRPELRAVERFLSSSVAPGRPSILHMETAGPHVSLSRFRERSPYHAYRVVGAVALRCPLRWQDAFPAVSGRRSRAVLPARRRMIARHLQRVHGGALDDRELRREVRRAFDSYARYWMEVFRLGTYSPAYIRSHMTDEGMEHVDEALAKGNGVIIAVTHLGNWDFGGAWLAMRGAPLLAVAEDLQPPELFEWFASVARRRNRDRAPGPRSRHRDPACVEVQPHRTLDVRSRRRRRRRRGGVVRRADDVAGRARDARAAHRGTALARGRLLRRDDRTPRAGAPFRVPRAHRAHARRRGPGHPGAGPRDRAARAQGARPVAHLPAQLAQRLRRARADRSHRAARRPHLFG